MVKIPTYNWECRLCDTSQDWTTERAAKAAAVWHTYENHPAHWATVIGDRLPRDARPETVGALLPKEPR